MQKLCGGVLLMISMSGISSAPANDAQFYRSMNEYIRTGELKGYPKSRLLDVKKYVPLAITSQGIVRLRELKNLEYLALGRSFDDKAIQQLQISNFRNLREVSFAQSGITNDGLRYLRQMPALEELVISDTSITDAGLPALLRIKTLRSVRIGHGTPINGSWYRRTGCSA